MSFKAKSKEKDVVQQGPPYFAQGQPGPSSLFFGISGPAGNPSPLLNSRKANGDQTSQISSEMGIDVTDDGITFETPKKTNEGPKKRNASVSETPNQPFKKPRVPGGRAPIPKRVTAELDSEDEIIVSMKKAGKTCTQIAKRLRDEGRINYRDKTITTRYVRIMRAQAERMEVVAAAEQIHWQEDDLQALIQAVTAVDEQLIAETERLMRRKWQMVVSHLRASRPGGIFSKGGCERRFNELMEEKRLNANNSEFQPKGTQICTPRPSASQPSASQPGNSKSSLDEFDDDLSFPPETDLNGHNSNDNMFEGEGSSEGDDHEYKDGEPHGWETEMGDAGYKAGVGGRAAPDAGNDAAKDAAEVAAILNRGLRAAAQKGQRNANSGSSSEHHVAVASSVSATAITEADILADNAFIDEATFGSYIYALDAAAAVPSIAATLSTTGDPAVMASDTTTGSEDAEHNGCYTVGKMAVCGRIIPEPAATGRRLIVRSLPCWVTPADVQMIFHEFQFTGSTCEGCDEGSWFVDVATAHDATRAVAALNNQIIMNELISVTVYHHPDMLGCSFDQWPTVFDLDCNLHLLQSAWDGVAGAE